jgi:hypothetical protein
MYLNLLLKKKKGPTHNFSFNGSTDIKTDKEHIHRGFKDHKGLSYSFNGPTKPTTDNKLVYKGFTKNYDGPHFHHTTNDTEYLKNFHLNPKTQPVELYTAYKNKYPKLSPNEYSIQTWQTEKGQPNELNRFMRQDKTGRSIEQIEIDDKDYSNGLQILEDHIRNIPKRINEIKEDESLTKEEKENEIQTIKTGKTVSKNVHKKINPVLIKPALEKYENYDILERSKSNYEKIDNALTKFGRHIKKSVGVDKKNESEEKSTKEKIGSKNKAEPTTPTEAKKAETVSLDALKSPVKKAKAAKVDDDSTEPIKYNQEQEVRILSQGKFNELLASVEPGKVKLSQLPETIAKEIIQLRSTLGIPPRTTLISTLKKYAQSVPSSVMSKIEGKAQDVLKQATKGKSKSIGKSKLF